jgi:nucleoid-associated protein YgaU
MTRETRIGLVLGLAFIIAFGAILTEVRQTGEPVRQAEPKPVLQPTYYRTEEPPMVPIAVQPAPRPTESHTTPPQPRQARLPAPRRGDPGVQAATIRRHEAPAEPRTSAGQPRRMTAHDVVERLAAAENGRTAAGRVHVVARGENFYRIAEKVYGPGKGHLWKRIYEANRSRVSEPGQLSVGQRIVIPPLEGRPAVPETNRLARRSQTPEPPRTVVRMYTVQRGDNLTSIAREQLRDASPAAVQRIIDANPQIQNPNAIPQGMQIRLPNG